MADKHDHQEEGTRRRSRLWKRLPKWLVIGTGSIVGLLVLSGGLYGFFHVSYAQRILPNTYIGSVDVGGLAIEAAEVRLTEAIHALEASEFTFRIDDEAVRFVSTDAGASYDIAASVQAAFEYGRSPQPWQNVQDQLGAFLGSSRLAAKVSFDQEKFGQFLTDLQTKFDQPEVNAHVEYVEGELTVVADETGYRFDRSRLSALLTDALKQVEYPVNVQFPLELAKPTVVSGDVTALLPLLKPLVAAPLSMTYEDRTFTVEPDQLADWIRIQARPKVVTGLGGQEAAFNSDVAFDSGKIGAYLTTLADDFNRDAIDAKLTIQNGKATVFQQSQTGWKIDIDGSTRAVVASLEQRRLSGQPGSPAQLVVSVTQPTVTQSTIEQLGIKELIGKGETDFSGSPNNRVHNITVGTRYINGWLIKPGETFSTVKALGAVDASTGYLPELVIKENKTIPEFGGGLCQVSTTLFRAVLNAGLRVTERKNHSYRVAYYEREVGPGLDATVYLPKPDFQFLNDTPGWILVQGQVKGNKVTLELYGTKDGRESIIDGPHVLSRTPAPPTVYEDTTRLAPGEQQQTEKPHDGAVTTVTYIVKRSGEELFRQTFNSVYKAIPAHILRGVGTPNPEPTPEPTQESTPSPEPTPEPTPTETTTPEPTPST